MKFILILSFLVSLPTFAAESMLGIYKCDSGAELALSQSEQAMNLSWDDIASCPSTGHELLFSSSVRVPFNVNFPVTADQKTNQDGFHSISKVLGPGRGLLIDSPTTFTLYTDESVVDCVRTVSLSEGVIFNYWAWDTFSFTDNLRLISCHYSRPSQFPRPCQGENCKEKLEPFNTSRMP